MGCLSSFYDKLGGFFIDYLRIKLISDYVFLHIFGTYQERHEV